MTFGLRIMRTILLLALLLPCVSSYALGQTRVRGSASYVVPSVYEIHIAKTGNIVGGYKSERKRTVLGLDIQKSDTATAVAKKLKEITMDEAGISVTILVATDTSHSNVLGVVSLCLQAEIRKLTIVTTDH